MIFYRSVQDVAVSIHEVIPEVSEVIPEVSEVIPEASGVIPEVHEVIPDAILEQEVTDDDGVKVQEEDSQPIHLISSDQSSISIS